MNRRTRNILHIITIILLAFATGFGIAIASTYPTIPNVCVEAFANADRGFELAGDGLNAILNNNWEQLDAITAQLDANPYAENRDQCLKETK